MSRGVEVSVMLTRKRELYSKQFSKGQSPRNWVHQLAALQHIVLQYNKILFFSLQFWTYSLALIRMFIECYDYIRLGTANTIDAQRCVDP